MPEILAKDPWLPRDVGFDFSVASLCIQCSILRYILDTPWVSSVYFCGRWGPLTECPPWDDRSLLLAFAEATVAALAEQMGCSQEAGSGGFREDASSRDLGNNRYDPYTLKLEIPKRHVGNGLLLVAAFPWMELRSIPCT